MSELKTTGKLPATVILAGRRFRVQESDGIIVFSEADAMWGYHERLSFTKRDLLWRVSLSSTSGEMQMSVIEKAYKFVREAYGDNWLPTPENDA